MGHLQAAREISIATMGQTLNRQVHRQTDKPTKRFSRKHGKKRTELEDQKLPFSMISKLYKKFIKRNLDIITDMLFEGKKKDR